VPDLHHPAGGARRGRLRALPGHPAHPVHLSLPDRNARGAVTAETAIALPVLVAVTLGLVWLVALAATQVRVVDAARETARALARDEPVATAVDLGRRVAPEDTRITVHEGSGEVRVRVVAEVRGPGGLFDFLPGVEVDAEAVAAKEAP
jgi:hypothetical protein